MNARVYASCILSDDARSTASSFCRLCANSIASAGMKVHTRFLSEVQLDHSYSLLSGRGVATVLEFFKMLDIRGEMALDDIQFFAFMRSVTDLSKDKIYSVFDMLDVDHSGLLDFDEFYLLVCILIAVRDRQEKQFIFHHSRSVFELLDADCSGNISAEEFESFGFLFNFDGGAIRQIFKEFDVSGDQELDYQEFKMFAMACIDRQNEIELKRKRQTSGEEASCSLQ